MTVAMGDVVNLRQARKRKAREAAETTAAENRVRFGRTGAEKIFEARKRREADTHLERGRLEQPQENREPVFRPQLHENKEKERFRGSEKGESALDKGGEPD